MKQDKNFLKIVCAIAVPVALQSMLQSSFSIIDQIMIGQLGSVSVAAVGLAGKFSSAFQVLVSAIGAVAGIMIAQYLGQKNPQEVNRSFRMNVLVSIILAGIFTVLCMSCPSEIMSLYTKDAVTQTVAADYLRIISFTYLPIAVATMLSTLLRCMELASLPLISSIVSAVVNTILNYILIFGKFGIAPMGAEGAAIATVASQLINVILMLLLSEKYKTKFKEISTNKLAKSDMQNSKLFQYETKESIQPKFHWKQYAGMLSSVLVCEFFWTLGENVYASIYGHLGTESCAAMTLTNPIQGLMIGALCGLSQAAGVIVGKKLGEGAYEEAYADSKKMIKYGFIGACILSVLLLLSRSYYVQIYQVEEIVKQEAMQILAAYATIAPFKILNMILCSGIIRSGGKTIYDLVIGMIGTWGFGVPLGLLSAFVLKLSIPYVYFILSLEECVRLGIGVIVFKRKRWMQILK